MIPPNFSFIICIFVSKLALLLFLTVKNRIYLTDFIGVFYPIFRHEILKLLPAASIHLLFNLGLENNLIMVLFRGTNIQKKLRAAAYKTENFPILTRKDRKKRAKNTILFAYMGEKSYLYTEKNMHNE